MGRFNINLNNSNTYDAIVIGSGISGGWAAKELCEKGLKTLVLEKGRMVNHVEDYPTMSKDAWDFEFRGLVSHEDLQKQHIQVRSGYISEASKHFFTNDADNPYQEVQRFDWFRGNQVGGRSLTWGRHTYRWSDKDFEANARDGIAIDWPIRYNDIAPWYTYVEKFIGVAGEKRGWQHLPDGEFLAPIEMNCIEKHFAQEIERKYGNRFVTMGRVAHLTEVKPWHAELGRGQCQNRNRCGRGCPFGAYFSSNAATLPAADKTGNLFIRPNTIVHSIILDKNTNKAKGVSIIDAETMKVTEFYAKIIFVCASTLASTQILLNSASNRFPNGLGNESGELGHNVMDHHHNVGAMGTYDELEDSYYKGRKPAGIFIPKYVNLDEQSRQPDFIRGFNYQGGDSGRANWSRGNNEVGIGGKFKDDLLKPGAWGMSIMAFGEVLPYHENKVSLHPELKDKWGIPQLVLDAGFKKNEWEMRKKMKSDAVEMLDKAGFKNIKPFDNPTALGNSIHEMGTARMGKDPKTSVLNEHNQIHGIPNVFVTDGSCMVSSNSVNPSLTYMALTARAADFAVSELNRKNM
jgi:choline dehydrogenase-like flavoprotein